jgi:hypothetical protein
MGPRTRARQPAGYSGTPLVKKLGVSEGRTLFPVGAPRHYKQLLGPLPAGARYVSRLAGDTDIVHLFTSERRELADRLGALYPTIKPDAAVWVSWPKKSAGVPTDITEDVIRAVALPLGFVDVKVCAVDETWSGLKLVIRKENRRAR